MTHWLHIGAVLLGMAALLLSAQGAAWLVSVWAPVMRLNFKPFNCEGCMTFWLTLIFMLTASRYIVSLPGTQAALLSLIFAFINYFYIHTKINIYD